MEDHTSVTQELTSYMKTCHYFHQSVKTLHTMVINGVVAMTSFTNDKSVQCYQTLLHTRAASGHIENITDAIVKS